MDNKISGIAAKDRLLHYITNASNLVYKHSFFKKQDRLIVVLLVIENNVYSIYNVLITPTEIVLTTACERVDDKEIETEFDKNLKELTEHSFTEIAASFDEIVSRIKDIYAPPVMVSDETMNEKVAEMLIKLKSIFSMVEIAKKLGVSDAAVYSWKAKNSFPRDEAYSKLRNLYSSHFSIDDAKKEEDTKNTKKEPTIKVTPVTPVPNDYTQELNLLKDLNQYLTLCQSCATNDMAPIKTLIENQIETLSNSKISNNLDFKDLRQRFLLLKTTMILQSFKIMATLIRNKADELLKELTKGNTE